MDNNKKLESKLLEITRQKEQADRLLLSVEIVLGVMSLVILIAFALAAAVVTMPTWLKILLVASGLVLFFVGATFALKIEQFAGFYKCAKCQHMYVPTFKQVFFAAHISRTRFMKCPKCKQWSWNRKVLTKN